MGGRSPQGAATSGGRALEGLGKVLVVGQRSEDAESARTARAALDQAAEGTLRVALAKRLKHKVKVFSF